MHYRETKHKTRVYKTVPVTGIHKSREVKSMLEEDIMEPTNRDWYGPILLVFKKIRRQH